MTPFDDLRAGDAVLSRPALEAAITAGRRSSCQKDKRGAAAWHPESSHHAAASNSPEWPFRCDGSAACRAACGKLAVHAEERALWLWEQQLHEAERCGVMRFPEVVHIAIHHGLPVTSGPPSCLTCSRTMLLHRVAAVWLWHDTGWRRYPMIEFHTLTLQHPKHQLPVIR